MDIKLQNMVYVLLKLQAASLVWNKVTCTTLSANPAINIIKQHESKQFRLG